MVEGARRPRSLRLWVVGALALVALLVVVLVGGSGREQPLVAVVLSPSPPASAVSESAVPSRPAPSRPGPSEPAPSEPPPFDLGQNVSVVWSPLNPWTEVHAIPRGNPAFMADHLREIVFDSCVTLCTGRFAIDVIVGTIDEGLVYGWRTCPDLTDVWACAIYQAKQGPGITLAVEGTTAAELAAGWVTTFGPAQQQQTKVVRTSTWYILTYERRSVAIVANGSRVVAVTVSAQGGLPAAAVQAMLERFLIAIQFGPEPNPGLVPPVSATLGDLTITMPANFVVTATSRGSSVVSIYEDTGSFLTIDDRITRLAPGAAMRIERTGGSTPATFEVRGLTLAEVTESIKAALGTAIRKELRIGDARGYRWRVPQQSFIHPLVAVAVIEWKGSFYVFEEHFPLGGAGPGNFDLVLQGVTLQ